MGLKKENRLSAEDRQSLLIKLRLLYKGNLFLYRWYIDRLKERQNKQWMATPSQK